MKTKQMKIKNNSLYLGSFKLSDLGLKYKTPLIVYDEEHINNTLDIFKENFKSDKYNCKVVYASKAFYCPYLGSILNKYDMWIDSVSGGDLYTIKHSGFDIKKAVLHGNNKSYQELEYAVSEEIKYIVVDNYQELEMLDKITKEKNKDIEILLRVNPGISAHTHEYIQTSSVNSKFGESIFDTVGIDKFVSRTKELDKITLVGFHCHIGSAISEASSFSKAASIMVDFTKEVQDRNDIEFPVLNLGGGFGIKYLDNDEYVDIKKMVKTIIEVVDKAVDDKKINIKQLLIEPGRSIVGDAGFTLYSVGYSKKTYGNKKYVFVDGGMTDNIRPALYQAKYTVDIVDKMGFDKEVVDVVGPCCESGDIVALDTDLQKASYGDILIAYATGAYGYSMSSNYNGRLRPEVIFVSKEKITTGIKRESYEDLLLSFPKKEK